MIGKSQLSQNIPARSIGGGSEYSETFRFTVSSQTGGIDIFYVSVDGGSYFSNNFTQIYHTGSTYTNISLERYTDNKIDIKIYRRNSGASAYSFPNISLSVKVMTFKPPNIT